MAPATKNAEKTGSRSGVRKASSGDVLEASELMPATSSAEPSPDPEGTCLRAAGRLGPVDVDTGGREDRRHQQEPREERMGLDRQSVVLPNAEFDSNGAPGATGSS